MTKKLATLILVAAGSLAAADLPYIGKWKFNPGKSDLKGTTVSYAQTSAGDMEYSADGLSYKFKTDGKEYPAVLGMTATWRQIDASTWESVDKLAGRTISTNTIKISGGKTMTVNSKGTKPNGQPFDESAVYERVSGGPGLAGVWKTTQVKVNAPNMLTIEPNGEDGLTVGVVEYQVVCKAKFDGRDYPATGPQVPPGLTLAIRKTGARSFEMTEKADGKPIYKVEFTVAADGKTMTEVGSAVATNEKVRIVYDRQ